MIHEISLGAKGSKLRGANGVIRAISDDRRTYAELAVDYVDEDAAQTTTRLFIATVPVYFQLHINELVELYTAPKRAGCNELHRILKLLAEHRLLELCVDVHLADTWSVRLLKANLTESSLAIGIDLPRGGAFSVQALETCRCFIVGRHQVDDRLFMTDSMRDYVDFGFSPF